MAATSRSASVTIPLERLEELDDDARHYLLMAASNENGMEVDVYFFCDFVVNDEFFERVPLREVTANSSGIRQLVYVRDLPDGTSEAYRVIRDITMVEHAWRVDQKVWIVGPDDTKSPYDYDIFGINPEINS